MLSERRSIEPLNNLIEETDFLISSMTPLPENRTSRGNEGSACGFACDSRNQKAMWIERLPAEQKAVGSNPSGRNTYRQVIRYLGQRAPRFESLVNAS